MKRLIACIVGLLVVAFAPTSFESDAVRIGSKKFTESVVLGECARAMAAGTGTPVTHFRELGGTRLVFDALCNGEIDAYPEYTGTIQQEILSDSDASLNAAMRAELRQQGVEMSETLGFNNTYALAMRRERAAELEIESISDLARHPEIALGFSNEFLDRDDGWPNLRQHYGLSIDDVRGLDHDLAYRQLKLGAIDVVDAYSTDAKIAVHDLVLLKDDREYFPRYDAVWLYRSDLIDRHPELVESLLRVTGAIDEPTMTRLNARVEVDRVPEAVAAAEFVASRFDIASETETSSMWERVASRTAQHLDLVRKSLIPAILLAIPLGVLAAKVRWLDGLILGFVGVLQTIPALALLVILMPLMSAWGLASIGLGSATAVTALLLYSLLPIVRNTHAGLRSIAQTHQESAIALGLPTMYRLLHIELPLASPSIFAGIKTAAVMNIGFATLGALIGAGGYGQPIVTGIRLNNTAMILEGAIPAAVLALIVQGGFELGERLWSS